MNMSSSINPDKAPSARFRAFGPIGVLQQWAVIDAERPQEIPAAAICLCHGEKVEDAKADAERIAYALNTIGRLLGDPAQPYMIADVDELAAALGKIGAQHAARAVEGLRQGEIGVATMFGAEARAIAAGGDTIRRMLAELLKFALVGDTLDEQAQAWLGGAYPALAADDLSVAVTAERFVAGLLDAYRKGAIAGMTRGLDAAEVAALIVRDVGELDTPGTEDLPDSMIVRPDELDRIVRRALRPEE